MGELSKALDPTASSGLVVFPQLSLQVPTEVISLCQTLRDAGWRAWVVGGCTRDMLLGREIQDWDLATDARPEEVRKTFRRVIPTGIQHGTVTVLLHGTGYEVTTLRGEGTYSDGRHPDEVTFVDDLDRDLARRDFTMNAIAWDPIEELLTDPFGGIGDIEARLIRAVGIARDRFEEDGLRILRAARFVATLGFDLDNTTQQAMKESMDRLRCVSCERVRDELLKTLGATQPSRGLRVMQETGVFERVLPELLPMVDCTQNQYHAYDVWEHTLQTVDACRPDPILRLVMLLHDIGKPSVRETSEKTMDFTFYHHEEDGALIAERIAERLRLSNEQQRRTTHLVRHHLIPYDPSWSDSAVRRWVRRVGVDHVDDLLEVARADAMGKGLDPSETLGGLVDLAARVEAIRVQGMALTTRDLAVNGRDLMRSVGLKPGPIIGEVLEHLLEMVTEDPSFNEREKLLEASNQFVRSRGE